MTNLLDIIIDKRCPVCQSENELENCLNCLPTLHDQMRPCIEDLTYKNSTIQITFCSYRKLKKILEVGKYKMNDSVFAILAKIMSNSSSFSRDTFFTFIPSSLKVDQQKGYNPAYEIAKNIAKSKNLPVFGLMGANKIDSQVNLTKEQRIENVKSKFFLKTPIDLSEYKVCVIVDDVITTGATMMAATDLISECYPHLSIIWLSPCKS